MKSNTLILISLIAAISALPAQDITPVQPEAIQKWQDARFGMFIQWGPVSLKGTEIGWSRGAQVPNEEYDNLYKQFNPTKFNADEWVAVAKAAGMKYMVLDGDPATRWATPADTKIAWLQIDFDKETTFNSITIEEANCGHGSNVRKFELQKMEGSSWVTFHNGSRLGAHFNASFEPVTTSAIRLHILDATKGPTISEIFIQTP
jgi:hypothetical protein